MHQLHNASSSILPSPSFRYVVAITVARLLVLVSALALELLPDGAAGRAARVRAPTRRLRLARGLGMAPCQT